MSYVSGNNLQDLADKMNGDLSRLYVWLYDNNLSLNTCKSKCTVAGNKTKLNILDCNVLIQINNVTLQQVSKMKNIIEVNLTFIL